jgi:hypothetical protein
LLVLRAVDVASEWRWLLSDPESGQPLADHAVDLDEGSDEVAVFGDLYGARGGARPRTAVGAAIVAAAPATVWVLVPAVLGRVLGWPLELAQVGGEACNWARDGGLRGQLAEHALYLSSRYCTNRPHSPVIPSCVTALYPMSGRGRSASS